MDKVAVVILNYESFWETEKCVDSILDKHLDVAGIVVVDNASANQSVPYLRKRYRGNGKVRVIANTANLGFAGGNNRGIRAARRIWNVDFVLLLNSDTVILEEDYLDRMLAVYSPRTGVVQSSALRVNGRYTQKNYGEYGFLGLVREVLGRACAYYHVYLPEGRGRGGGKRLGPWVSGCDILLTPAFFRVFRGLYPLTFLYGEEHILAMMLEKAGLCWEVAEDAHILHAESRSTPEGFREGTLRKRKMMLAADRHKLAVRILPLGALRRIVNGGAVSLAANLRARRPAAKGQMGTGMGAAGHKGRIGTGMDAAGHKGQ